MKSEGEVRVRICEIHKYIIQVSEEEEVEGSVLVVECTVMMACLPHHSPSRLSSAC